MSRENRPLEDFRPPVKLLLSALWASLMFLYIYGDYFNLYTPGKLEKMAAGDIGFGPATETALLAVSAMMAFPAVMVFLSLALAPAINRWLNLLLGLAYTAIMALTMPGAPLFYIFLGALEISLTLLIAFLALTWRREAIEA